MSGETAASAPALAFDGVTFSYGEAPLMDNLDASFESSCVTGVVGPNGCGKSTLLKLAGGLLKPRMGKVAVQGSDVHAMRAVDRARLVALLPQDTPAVSMPVRDLVLSGRYAHLGLLQVPQPDDRAAAEDALAAVGLSALAERPVRALSGGQRQRAYLAMLLAQRAPVMLLDEPTSALDIRAAHDVLALVREVRAARDATVIIVMHDLDLALRYCDRIAVMDAGRLIEHGPTREVVATGAIERAFDIELTRHDTPNGPAYTFAPR